MSRYGVIAILIATLLVLMFVIPSTLRRAVLFTGPVLGGLQRVTSTVSTPIRFVRGIADLRNELATLRRENAELQSRIAALETVERENSILREQLNVTTVRSVDQRIVATVVGRDPIGADQRLVVNAGAREGVREGATVIAADGRLVGRVVTVGTFSSFVEPIVSSTSRIDVRVLPADVRGVVQSHDGFLSVDLLPREQMLTDGASVVTSGGDGLYPPGIAIGTLGPLLSEETDIFQRRRLENNVDTYTARSVFIISFTL